MLATVFCASLFISCVSAAALRTQRDGFILQDIDGERHFGYGVVPAHPGESMRLEFYDVDFASQNCSDIRVDVYSNGYLKTEKDLVETFCDPAALGDFVCDSNKGFYVAMTSSSNVHSGQIKARFSAPAGFKVTHEVFHR